MKRNKREATPGRRLARQLAVGWLTLTGLTVIVGVVHADPAPLPRPRDSDGNLSNTITSTSPGANCVTGTEPGCSTLTVRAVPMMFGGDAATWIAIPLTALGAAALCRRREERHWPS